MRDFELLFLQDARALGQVAAALTHARQLRAEADGHVRLETHLPFLVISTGERLKGILRDGLIGRERSARRVPQVLTNA